MPKINNSKGITCYRYDIKMKSKLIYINGKLNLYIINQKITVMIEMENKLL